MGLIYSKAYDPAHDPYAATVDDISAYFHIQSVTKGGTFLDLKAPSAANYPDALAGTPTRYFLYMPMRIDRSDLGASRPIVVKDETGAVTLTRVTGSPSTNEYKIPPENSIRRNAIELHSGQAGKTISYDYYGEATMYSAEMWNRKHWVNNYTITADYTVLDNDCYDRIDVAHSASTKLVTITLPTLADNIGRRIRIQNTGTGLTLIDGEGAETLSLFGNSLTTIKLLTEDDYIELVAEATDWKVEHCYISMITNWINRSDWTNVQIGSAFTYDTKSAGVDLTGAHITETTSNTTAVVLYDSGGTGSSGILYVYNIAVGTGIWTNDRVVTCGSGGYTVAVNEGTGSSKNINYNIYGFLGINQAFFSYFKILISSANSYDGSYIMDYSSNPGAGLTLGASFCQTNVSTLTYQTDGTGLGVYPLAGGGNPTIVDVEDWYVNIIIKINF